MTSISYGGKPSFCCFENLQAVKNYIRILKNSYSEYHYDCTTTPGENGECCTICDLSGGQLTVDSIIVNGITYDNPATTPAPFNLFINSPILKKYFVGEGGYKELIHFQFIFIS
jgi:hypothetical protein